MAGVLLVLISLRSGVGHAGTQEFLFDILRDREPVGQHELAIEPVGAW